MREIVRFRRRAPTSVRRDGAISKNWLLSLQANEDCWLHCYSILTDFTSASLVTQLPVRRFCYSGPISNWHTVCIVLSRPALISLAFAATQALLRLSAGPIILRGMKYRTIIHSSLFFSISLLFFPISLPRTSFVREDRRFMGMKNFLKGEREICTDC